MVQSLATTPAILMLLGPLILMGALAMDIFIPFVPLLGQEFQASSFKIQQTLNIFMFFMAVGQLVIGPLSDQYGRKKLLLLSIFLYGLGSAGCFFMTDIDLFIAARGLQALGSCGAQVITYALIRDLSHGTQAQTLFSYLLGILGMAPITAPLMGTYLAHTFGDWRVIFILLTGYAAFLFTYISLFLKEPKRNQQAVPSLNECMMIISHPSFKQWMLVPALVLTGLFLFFGMSSYYVQQFLGYSRWTYSLIFSFNAVLYSLSSFSSPFIIKRFGIEKTLRGGLIGIIVATSGMLLQSVYAPDHLGLFLLGIYACCLSYGCIQGAGIGLALEPFKNNAGLASALLGSAQFLCAWAFGTFAVYPPIESSVSFALPMLLLALTSYAASFGFPRVVKSYA